MNRFFLILTLFTLMTSYSQKQNIKSFKSEYCSIDIKQGDTLVFGKGAYIDPYGQKKDILTCLAPFSTIAVNDNQGKYLIIDELTKQTNGQINAKVHYLQAYDKREFKIMDLEKAFFLRELVHNKQSWALLANPDFLKMFNYLTLVSKEKYKDMLYDIEIHNRHTFFDGDENEFDKRKSIQEYNDFIKEYPKSLDSLFIKNNYIYLFGQANLSEYNFEYKGFTITQSYDIDDFYTCDDVATPKTKEISSITSIKSKFSAKSFFIPVTEDEAQTYYKRRGNNEMNKVKFVMVFNLNRVAFEKGKYAYYVDTEKPDAIAIFDYKGTVGPTINITDYTKLIIETTK